MCDEELRVLDRQWYHPQLAHNELRNNHHYFNSQFLNPDDEKVQIYTIDHEMQSLHFSYNISQDLLDRISHQIGIDQYNDRKD